MPFNVSTGKIVRQCCNHLLCIIDLPANELRCDSYCVILNHLKHNQTSAHCFLTKLLSLIRNDLPHTTSIKYFTDGAALQHKQFKALINLAFHFHDRKLQQNIFAISHGKSPCDGIGGTIKKDAAKASLRAIIDNQIIPLKTFTAGHKIT